MVFYAACVEFITVLRVVNFYIYNTKLTDDRERRKIGSSDEPSASQRVCADLHSVTIVS